MSYVDNAKNRKLGRVGMPYGSKRVLPPPETGGCPPNTSGVFTTNDGQSVCLLECNGLTYFVLPVKDRKYTDLINDMRTTKSVYEKAYKKYVNRQLEGKFSS